MKVGILTFHEGLNHGAYLQAYCTMQAVRQLGHDPVIINYKNRTHWIQEDVRPWLAYRRPIRFLDRWQKQRAFKRDHKAMPLTGYTHDPDEVRKWHFDAVIVGSDVVWDTSIFGFDSLYFGDLNTDRLIAYAASCGSDDYTGNVSVEISERLKRFDAISVRDANTEEMVFSAIATRPLRVMDPVFLPENMDDFIQADISIAEPYVLVYGGQYSDADGAFIRTFAQRKNLKLISVGARNFWADQCLLSVGPLEILSYFKRAEFVFSSTFHGCIFALRCEKNFVARIHPAIHNKVTSLLELLGLPERGATQLDGLSDMIENPVDYGPGNEVLTGERAKSLGFLKAALAE